MIYILHKYKNNSMNHWIENGEFNEYFENYIIKLITPKRDDIIISLEHSQRDHSILLLDINQSSCNAFYIKDKNMRINIIDVINSLVENKKLSYRILNYLEKFYEYQLANNYWDSSSRDQLNLRMEKIKHHPNRSLAKGILQSMDIN